MPLVRYELRCEHSLASPELYRFVGQDDSQGLLEGVAMAGLVGVVRQLGDLTELATGIFHDLYDDVITIASRGSDLKARVESLEADLSVVEKALHAEASQCRFAYTARSKWRAPLPIDQNLYVQGKLPRFIRNFYDDCRFPPRLFLLDPFDEAGQGACVKRYSDPTFFRLNWATTKKKEVEEAKLGRQTEQDKITGANKALQEPRPLIHLRDRLSSAHFENVKEFARDLAPDSCSQRQGRVLEMPIKGDLTTKKIKSSEKHISPEVSILKQESMEADESSVADFSNISIKAIKRGRPEHTSFETNTGREFSEQEASCYVDASATTSDNVDFEAHSRSRLDMINRVDSIPDSHCLVSPGPEKVASSNSLELRENVKYSYHKLPPQEVVEQNHINDSVPKQLPEEHQTLEFHSVDPDSDLVCEASTEIIIFQTANDNHQEAYCSSEGAENELNITSCTKEGTQNPSVHVHKCSPKLSKLRHKPPYQSHPSISLQHIHRTPTRVKGGEQGVSLAASGQIFTQGVEVSRTSSQHSQLISAKTGQIVSIPNISSLCVRDSALEVATCGVSSQVSSLEHNGGRDLTGCIESCMSDDGQHSQEEIQRLRGIILHGEAHVEQKVQMSSRTGLDDLFNASTSNVSNSYSNIASSPASEDDGYTSSTSESSMKGTNVYALLSPPNSPPSRHCVFVGSATFYNSNSQYCRDGPKAPPMTPFLSLSPTESRSSSMKHESLGSFVDELLGTHPEEANPSQPLPEGNGGSLSPHVNDDPIAGEFSSPSTPTSRTRMESDRLESNLTFTSPAIRQPATFRSDDESGNTTAGWSTRPN